MTTVIEASRLVIGSILASLGLTPAGSKHGKGYLLPEPMDLPSMQTVGQRVQSFVAAAMLTSTALGSQRIYEPPTTQSHNNRARMLTDR